MLKIGTISVMVNAICNLKCLHCDLPRTYNRYQGALSAKDWESLIERVCAQLLPKTVAIAAMEPMLPRDQEKSLAIMRVALAQGLTTGFVTNGMFLEQFHKRWPDFRPSFLDISIEGSREIDQHIRGPEHFDVVERVLKSGIVQTMTDRFYLSCCLNDLNVQGLPTFLDWAGKLVPSPRVVLIALYNNHNVDPSVSLSECSLRQAIKTAAQRDDMEEIILDVFPTAPGLDQLRGEGILPGPSECQRDAGGIECGWVSGRVYVRFYNLRDLALHQLRISPEGHVLTPAGYENPDYLKHSLGSLLTDDWNSIEKRIIASISK